MGNIIKTVLIINPDDLSTLLNDGSYKTFHQNPAKSRINVNTKVRSIAISNLNWIYQIIKLVERSSADFNLKIYDLCVDMGN